MDVPGLVSGGSKDEVDLALCDSEDMVVLLRFGKSDEAVTMEMDAVLGEAQPALRDMAVIVAVDADAVPEYVSHFEITHLPSTIFFYNCHQMKIDFGSGDHTKFVGAFREAQDCIDVVEAVFRGAMHGKTIVESPIAAHKAPRVAGLLNGF